MPFAGTETTPQMAEGLLQKVDLVNRVVTLARTEDALTFDVPPTCEVLLNGERVKLRLLQPRDRLSVTYCRQPGGFMALSLDARTRL